ncbi:DUF2225 domain-containing protein [Lachnospiraceae bacterium JLR.KK008]
MSEVSGNAGGCPSDEQYVFGKNHTCPICELEFKNPTVKSSKARMIGSDIDLRPIYETVNTLKYDVVLCPQCGYTALERYFDTVTQVQKRQILEKVCTAYKPREAKTTYSYEDAFFRYKMALINSMAKNADDSEKAFICLRCGWLLRAWRQSLEGEEGQEAKREELAKQEDEYLRSAKGGFEQANLKEDYPLCGMDESTVDYLIAALSLRYGEYDAAMKLVSGIIASREAGARIKDRARDLKDEIVKSTKGQ